MAPPMNPGYDIRELLVTTIAVLLITLVVVLILAWLTEQGIL